MKMEITKEEIERAREETKAELEEELKKLEADLKFRRTKSYKRWKQLNREEERLADEERYFRKKIDEDTIVNYEYSGYGYRYSAGYLIREILKELGIKGLKEQDKLDIARTIAERIIEESKRRGFLKRINERFKAIRAEMEKIEKAHPEFDEYAETKELIREIARVKKELAHLKTKKWEAECRREIERKMKEEEKEELKTKEEIEYQKRVSEYGDIEQKILNHEWIQRLIDKGKVD